MYSTSFFSWYFLQVISVEFSKRDRVAATVATILFAIMIALQLLMACGVVPISIAWGGHFQDLSISSRLASFGAAAILGVFTYVIRRRIVHPFPLWIRVAAWLITGYMVLNTLGNFLGTRIEKMFFGPMTVILSICCSVVASSSSEPQFEQIVWCQSLQWHQTQGLLSMCLVHLCNLKKSFESVHSIYFDFQSAY